MAAPISGGAGSARADVCNDRSRRWSVLRVGLTARTALLLAATGALVLTAGAFPAEIQQLRAEALAFAEANGESAPDGGVVVVRFAGDGSERRLMLDYAPLTRIA